MIKDFIRTVRVRAVRTLASTRPRLDVSGRRVLVVAPHPDDEVFGCAGLVQQLVQSGTQVDVVIVTGGVKATPLVVASTRPRSSVSAAHWPAGPRRS